MKRGDMKRGDMKRGEADHVGQEPPVGTTRTDGDGRRWRKRRHLGVEAWRKALLDAEFDRRLRGVVSVEQVRAMGYEPEEVPDV